MGKKMGEKINLTRPNFYPKSNIGQISTEALIVIGFILLLITTLIGIAFIYIRGINDRVTGNQINNYADKLISASENVYYSGEPSMITINVFVPDGIKNIDIIENNLVINVSLSSGDSLMAFLSSVPLEGNLSTNAGVKKIQIEALVDRVLLTELE